ncbi:DUF1648 domain-containing protein [Streptomyces albofaciens JCM 4342]|uniref:DUF1648 domain-containing protein n=1 Tax=Streptomyces albofaciens TaxID=66866 RepID=UPI0012384A6D|nr:DUF1648 domain-containing protein [Streptomyces albofaciens]KAA6214275.1 DUF1648 domain-containing protein [Streptomyces albofaciens JCM 4342]
MAIFSSPIRPWLLPSAVLLAAQTIWGALRYPHLPGRIPWHIGSGAVDTWADKSVGSAFILVFVYAGVTVVTAGSAELTLRVTPRDELTAANTPFAAARAASSLINRPASRASARRIARAVLLLNACIGTSLLMGCGLFWRSTPDPNVPVGLLAAMLVPVLIGTAVVIGAAARDRKR